jgi:hypothetical protein
MTKEGVISYFICVLKLYRVSYFQLYSVLFNSLIMHVNCRRPRHNKAIPNDSNNPLLCGASRSSVGQGIVDSYSARGNSNHTRIR